MADLIDVSLTYDELTRLMHVLEAERNRAHQAVIFAGEPRAPHFRPMAPEIQEEQRNAAGDAYLQVTELCDRVTDIWRENWPDNHRRDLLAAQ